MPKNNLQKNFTIQSNNLNSSCSASEANHQQMGPGVKSIHITHAQTLPQGSEYISPHHQVLMNVSSTSSNSSYYSTNTASSNQSPSHSYSVPNQLYSAKSSTNLSQYHQSSPVKLTNSQSATSSPANVCRSRSSTLAGNSSSNNGSSPHHSTFKGIFCSQSIVFFVY